jgi:hypothetical protein
MLGASKTEVELSLTDPRERGCWIAAWIEIVLLDVAAYEP